MIFIMSSAYDFVKIAKINNSNNQKVQNTLYYGDYSYIFTSNMSHFVYYFSETT